MCWWLYEANLWLVVWPSHYSVVWLFCNIPTTANRPEQQYHYILYTFDTRQNNLYFLFSLLSTSIVGTDIRMSNLDIRLSNLDIRMSSLDIRMSKLILEFGKNKTAKNSEILVAFRIYFHFFNTPYGWKIRARYAKRHNQDGHTLVQVGHTYVQAEYIGWTYVCPTL